MKAIGSAARRLGRGVRAAMRERPGLLLGITVATLVLYVALPVAVLSVVRKPMDFFTVNPWLRKLPAYLLSAEVPLGKKLEFLPGLALFWFSADGPFGAPEWGFAVDLSDLGRLLALAFGFGLYFALWATLRDRRAAAARGARLARPGGAVGALASVVGFTTGPCSVVGCGAPVMPVVGLALTELSSGTVAFLASLSQVASAMVLSALLLGVGWLAWQVGDGSGRGAEGAGRGLGRGADPAPATAGGGPARPLSPGGFA